MVLVTWCWPECDPQSHSLLPKLGSFAWNACTQHSHVSATDNSFISATHTLHLNMFNVSNYALFTPDLVLILSRDIYIPFSPGMSSNTSPLIKSVQISSRILFCHAFHNFCEAFVTHKYYWNMNPRYAYEKVVKLQVQWDL